MILRRELGLEVGVSGRAERDPLPLPVHHQPGGHRLHPPGGQLGHDLLPQHGRDLVPVQPVEHPARLVGVHLALVELLRVGDGAGDRLRSDLVEDHPAGRHLGLELLEQVPGDGLALAVFIGGEQELVGVLEQALELGDLLPLVAVHDEQWLEVVVHVDAEPGPRLAPVLGRDLGRAVRHVADVADAGLDHVALAEVPGDGAGLRRGLDDDQLGTAAVTRDGRTLAGPLAPPPRPALAGALVALAVVPAFVFVVSVLAGTLFPSSYPRRDRLTVPVVTRRPTAATTGPVRCVPSCSPEYTADFTTAGRITGELKHNRTDGRVRLPRRVPAARNVPRRSRRRAEDPDRPRRVRRLGTVQALP